MSLFSMSGFGSNNVEPDAFKCMPLQFLKAELTEAFYRLICRQELVAFLHHLVTANQMECD